MEWNTKSFTRTKLNGILTPKYDNEVHTMKKIKELSLILSGVVLGLGLSFSSQIYAATSSLLGAKVDKVITVQLDDKNIGQAIAINGVSYLPVRSLSTALDVGVDYKSSVISLTSSNEGGTTVEDVPANPVEEVVVKPIKSENLTIEEKNVMLDEITSKMNSLKINIRQAKDALVNKESYANVVITFEQNLDRMRKYNEAYPGTYSEETIKYNEDKYEAAKVLMSNYEKNLPIWEVELADLEAQLATLK